MSLCLRQRRFGRAGQGDDFDGKSFERRQQVEQLLRFAGIAQRQNHVAVVDEAEVAVERIHAVEHHARGAGAGERGGDFLADVAGFADAHHDDFGALRQCARNRFHRVIKGRIKLRANGFERGQFNVEYFPGLDEMLHCTRMQGSRALFNPEWQPAGRDGYFVCANSMKTRGPRAVAMANCSSGAPVGMAMPSQCLSWTGWPSASSM